MLRFDKREREAAVGHWLPRGDDMDAVVAEPGTAADVGRGLASDEHRTGAVRDGGAVHDVVEVSVHGQHGIQPASCVRAVEPEPGEGRVDAGGIGRQLAECDLAQGGPGEEAVSHHGAVTVIEQQRGDADERDGEVSCGGRHVEQGAVRTQVRAAEFEAHGGTVSLDQPSCCGWQGDCCGGIR